MKKKAITLLLSLVLASGSIGNAQVLAADTTGQEAEPLQEEETTEQEEEPVQEEELAEETDTENSSEDVSEPEEEAEPVQENEEQIQEDEGSETEEFVDEEESDISEEAAAEVLETEETEITDESKGALADVVDSGSCGDDVTWALTGEEDNLTLTISGNGRIEDREDPNAPWGPYRYEIRKVVVEEGIKSLGGWSFWSHYKLTDISLPDSLTEINEYEFEDCKALQSIRIPANVTRIGPGAFNGCGKLKKIYISDINAWCRIKFASRVPGDLYLDGKLLTDITIPDGITQINSYSFSNKDSMKSITIPDSVTIIGDDAFSDCSSLTSISIPNSVTSIGEYAFYNCSSLKSIMIPINVTRIDEDAFSGCSSLTSIKIPDGVKSIDRDAFSDCSNLKSITIPNSVNFIGYSAFDGCNNLSEIYIDDIDNWCRIIFFDHVPGNLYLDGKPLTEVTIPDDITEIDYYPFSGRKYIKSITIPDSVTSIGYSAFRGCDSLMSITIPDGVTSIEENTFSGCSSLTSITIPDSVTSIGEFAFSGCSSLRSITIPDGVSSIYEGTFENCSSLERITIPDSITCIGGNGDSDDYYDYYGVFDGCNKLNNIYINDIDAWCRINFHNYVPGNLYLDGKLLTEVTIPDGITVIDYYPLSRRESIKSITIPDSVTSIDDSAFRDCSSLTSITIPDSVTSIGDSAFSGCSSLASITIPDNVTSIGDSVFSGCGSLTSITIPGSVSTIGAWFSGCNNLKSVTILNGVTSIGYEAFYNCSSLTNVSIPNTVTSIGYEAFNNCSNLTNITIPDSLTSIGGRAFDGCDSLKSLAIPNSVTYIDDWAFPRYSNDTNDFVIFTQSQYVKEYCKKNGYAYFDKTAPSIAKLTSHNGSDIRVYFEKRDEAIEKDYLFWNECVLGYQIKYADNKNMTGAKSIMLKDKKAASKVITGLKNGKTYYVQIQHYLKSGKVSYWSKWSPVTSVTVGQTPYNTNVSKLSTYIGSHIKVDWTKTAGASGYHIKYADNSSMTGAKEVMVKGNSTFTKTLTGLKNGKTYYVKIQTYRTVSGKTYWSSWSPAKSIKVDQIPYGSSIKNLTRVSATQMKVTWDKAPSASGYHIQYRWYDGNSGKYVTKDIIINGNGTVSKTITGLKKYGDYEVRIQTFRKISGKTYWSSWSKYKYVYLW